MNRRKFITNSLITSASLPFLAPVGLARSQRKKLGIALVGLGGYATKQLAPALSETHYCQLAGIVTGTKAKEAQWLSKYSIPKENVYNYGNFDAIADNDDIDIVYIVLPNAMHAEYTIRAAQAGKHVICEKPMAINVAECKAMIKACQESKVKLSIGYRLHFDPNHQKVMSLAKEQPYGPIKLVESEFAIKLGKPNQWRLDKKLAGGGAVYDIGVYCIQAARYATGEEPIAVAAREFKTDPVKFKDVDETVMFQMRFPSGAVSNSTTSYNARINRLHVSAGKTTYELQPAYSYRGVKGQAAKKPFDFVGVNQQAKQMDGFALNILNETESTISGEEGLRDMRVIEALYQSIDTDGAWIKIA